MKVITWIQILCFAGLIENIVAAPEIQLGGDLASSPIVMRCMNYAEVGLNKSQVLADEAHGTNSLLYQNTDSTANNVKPVVTFKGTIKFIGGTGKLAIISDDGCTVKVTPRESGAVETVLINRAGSGQKLDANAYKELSYTFLNGVVYDVYLEYSQTSYTPQPDKPDIDGATLYAYFSKIALDAKITAIQTDLKDEGNRRSDSSLLFALSSSDTVARKAELRAELTQGKEFPDGYPKWSGLGIENNEGNANDGKTRVNWSSIAPGTHKISVKLDQETTKSIDISVIPAPKVEVKIQREKIDSYKKKINDLINTISEVEDAVAIDGEMTGFLRQVDLHNDGEQLGKHFGIKGEISFGTKELNPKTKPIPIAGQPWLTVQFGVKLDPIKVKVSATGEYNASLSPAGIVSGTITGSATVGVTAEVVAGYNDGENVIGLSCEGTASTSVTASGTLGLQYPEVYTEGKVAIGGLDVQVAGSFKLGPLGKVELFDAKVKAIDGGEEEFPKSTLHTFS